MVINKQEIEKMRQELLAEYNQKGESTDYKRGIRDAALVIACLLSSKMKHGGCSGFAYGFKPVI